MATDAGTASPGARAPVRVPGFLTTARRDGWYVGPVLVGVGLLAFGVYSTLRAFEGTHYQHDPYLSPFYSPLITPSWWPFSPAVLILWAPLGFRVTCYYYRKAYYRAFFGSPPACAVGSLTGAAYRGEHRGLLTVMNLHRLFLYLALAILVVLWIDAVEALHFPVRDGTGAVVGREFGIGVGTLVLFANAALLTGFTLGCNSLRHLAGGATDCFSCASTGGARQGAWRLVTVFNVRHMQWAWLSLFSVGLADLYVTLVARGVIADLRLV